MKKKKFLLFLATICIASNTIFFTGCSNQSGGSATTSQQSENAVLNFVAADQTNWDKEVSVGDYAYTFHLDLANDNTFLLTATCVGAAPQEQQQGGMGDFGNFGGDEEESKEDAPEEESMEEASTDEKQSDEDFSKNDFTMDGTWEYETGWGYTLTFNDGHNTVITADFDKASSRHYFYYNMEVDGTTTQVQFQAEDQDFRKEMASDYVIAEERNATYIFEGNSNTSTGNAAKASIYLEKDGTAAIISMSGSTTSYATGTWNEDSSIHQITMIVDGKESAADYCDIEGKEGYRLAYESSAGMGPATTIQCYAPVASGVKARDYEAADFEGGTIMTGTCAEADYELALTEKGYVSVLSEGSTVETGKYIYDEATDAYTVTISTGVFTTEKSGAGYSLTADMPLTGMAAMMGGDAESRTFTLQ